MEERERIRAAQEPDELISPTERSERRDDLKERLWPDIVPEGFYAHADVSVDEFSRMITQNRFWHIPLVKCITRDQELDLGDTSDWNWAKGTNSTTGQRPGVVGSRVQTYFA